MSLDLLRQAVYTKVGERDSSQKKLLHAQAIITAKTALLHAQENALALIQITAKETQNQLKLQIESIVQTALDAVFPSEYKFVVDYDVKRDRTEAVIYIEQDGERMNPLDDNGGGLADVLSFALRLVAWSLGKTSNTLIMDEPAKNVSDAYKPLVMEMLNGLSSQLGLQTIIVTHDANIVDMADRVFDVQKVNKRSIVRMK